MFKKIIVLLLGVLFLTGCGANIRQEGNKIYTDISKDKAYDFATAAVQTRSYSITKEDEKNYTFTAVPDDDNGILGSLETNKKSVQVAVTNSTKPNETIVTILAMIGGNVDQESSEALAKRAVADIIAELNKYGKFNSQKSAQYVYAIATPERVDEYISEYLDNENLVWQKRNNTYALRETKPNNQFNEPLVGTITMDSEEDTGRLTVVINAAVQGNYDVAGNQAYVDNFVANFLGYMDTYPVVEKGTRHTYRYITFDKAFANARNAAVAAGYTIKETDRDNFFFSGIKNKLNIAVTFTQINTSTGVNIEAFIEGEPGETKANLTDNVNKELTDLTQQMAAYQTIFTSDKAFLSNNQNEVLSFVRSALGTLGYTYSYSAGDLSFSAVDKVNANKAHYIVVNNLGTSGVVVQINTLYNDKSANAETIVRTENDKLLRALGNYDSMK